MADSGKFYCPHCGRKYRWKAEVAGRKLRCFCQARIRCPKFRQNGGTAELIEAPPGGGAAAPVGEKRRQGQMGIADSGETAFHTARPTDADNAMDRTYTAMSAVAWGAFSEEDNQDDADDGHEGDDAAADEAWGAAPSATQTTAPAPSHAGSQRDAGQSAPTPPPSAPAPSQNPLDDSDHGESDLEDMLFANAGSGGGELSIPSDESGEQPIAPDASDAGNPLDEMLFSEGHHLQGPFDAGHATAPPIDEPNPLADFLSNQAAAQSAAPEAPARGRRGKSRPLPPTPRIGRGAGLAGEVRIGNTAPEQEIRCPTCGTPSIRGAMVCLNCGSSFNNEPTVDLASLAEPTMDNSTIDLTPTIRDGMVDLDSLEAAKARAAKAAGKRGLLSRLRRKPAAGSGPANRKNAPSQPAQAAPTAAGRKAITPAPQQLAKPKPRPVQRYQPSRWRDLVIPAVLILLAAGISVIDAVFVANAAGSRVALLAAITVGLALILQVPLLLLAVLAGGRFTGADFGPLHIALLKIGGIALATLTLCVMVINIFGGSPQGLLLALAVQSLAGLGLIKWLFRLTWTPSLAMAATVLMVNAGVFFALRAALAMLLPSM